MKERSERGNLAGFQDGGKEPGPKEGSQTPRAGKGNGVHFLLDPSERNTALPTFLF